MQNILDDLYYGNLCPSDKPLLPGSPAEKAHATFYETALQLEKTLRGEEKSCLKGLRTPIRRLATVHVANISPTASALARASCLR